MSWTDFYRRQEILEATVRQAGRNPGAPLPLDEVPGAEDHFGCEENVLAALQYKWTQVLAYYCAPRSPTRTTPTASATTSTPSPAPGAPPSTSTRRCARCSTAGSSATRRCAACTTASCGCSPSPRGWPTRVKPADEITKVGHTLEALLRTSREQSHCPRRPMMSGLRRLLAPSA